VERSAAAQVERNKAVSAKAISEAADQDVAPAGGKKRGFRALLASLFGRKNKK